MSIRVMAAVWDGPVSEPGDLLVLLALANFADDQGYCFPAMATVARLSRMSERGARKAVRRLEEMGYLRTEIGGGRGGANRYRVIAKPELSSPFNGENPELSSEIKGDKPGTQFPRNSVPPGTEEHQNPELDDTKPGTPVPPNRHEPSKEPSKTPAAKAEQPFEHPDRTADQDRFPEFWAAFPLKQNQTKAQAEFMAACITTAADQIIAGAKAYAAARAGQDPRYTTQPASWLRDKRWTDETPAAPKQLTDRQRRFQRIAARYP